MPQLAQRLGLDLADALAGHLEVLAHLFQGVVGLLAMPKRMRRTFSSRGVSVASTFRVCSARFMLMTASEAR